MKADAPLLDHELQALIQSAQRIPKLSDVVRARALARARTVASFPAAGPKRGVLLALVLLGGLVGGVTVGGAIGAAVGLASMRLHPGPDTSEPAPPSKPFEPPRLLQPSASSLPEVVSRTRAKRARRSVSTGGSYATEMVLLQRAQAAFADRDFAGALAWVEEHERRFPGSDLAEEREALRVKSLLAAGHETEGRLAASAFADRFPRSALVLRPPRRQPSPE